MVAVQFEFKIKAQKEAMCSKVLMEPGVGSDFQAYMQRLGFSQCRLGFLYGRFDDKNQAQVEVVYEPPQEGSAEGFALLDDPRAERVAELAEALQLTKVGWIFAHPPREEGFIFSGSEVTVAAVEQLEAAQGVKDTPFVTVRVSLHQNEGEEHPSASVDAFQVPTTTYPPAATASLHPACLAACWCGGEAGEQAVHGDGGGGRHPGGRPARRHGGGTHLHGHRGGQGGRPGGQQLLPGERAHRLPRVPHLLLQVPQGGWVSLPLFLSRTCCLLLVTTEAARLMPWLTD